jgi:predicted helicase
LAHEAEAVNEVKRRVRFTVLVGNPPYSNFGQLNKIPFILQLLDNYKRGLEEKKINLDDDFIKFVRFSQHLIDSSGAGVHGMITNNVYFDGLTHRQMRQSLLQSFSTLWLLDLHGSTKRLETTPNGLPDENVFDILVGVGISLFLKRNNCNANVFHSDLWGKREEKYSSLNTLSSHSTKWTTLKHNFPNFFFIPKCMSGSEEYELFEDLKGVFKVFGNGIGTDRDDLFYDLDRQKLMNRIKYFYLAEGLERPFSELYRVQDSSSYSLLSRRNATQYCEDEVRQCLYRPFDIRWLYYDPKLISRPAYEVMRHHRDNQSLLVTRQVSTNDFRHVFVSKSLVDRDPLSLVTRERSQVFPLYLHAADGSLEFGDSKQLNLNDNFLRKLGDVLQLNPHDSNGVPQGLTPEDIFNYIYTILYSPTYRTRYSEFLKIDFPRVPLTPGIALFRSLAKLGSELVALHLLESPTVNNFMTTFTGRGDNSILKKPTWKDNAVWINPTQRFEGVQENIWNFYIGGYQVCEKWLKDRKGRTLSKDDITHYQRIVVALNETIRIMDEIDQVINAHGGWPKAFQDQQKT